MSDKDVLGMSDEDFLKLNSPVENTDDKSAPEETPSEQPSEPVQEEAAPDTTEAEEASPEETDESQEEPADGDSAPVESPQKEPAKPSAKSSTDEKPVVGKPEASGSKSDGSKSEDASKEVKEKEAKETVVDVPDYEGFYNQIMAPFKANGKEFKPQSPEEAIRLMQMGAGYGRKLQDLQPALKTLRMLEKHDLLNENELSFLIEVRNKNPDAIKKLIKDSGIDPLDLGDHDNVSYTPVNHAVSNEEMAFQEALDEVQAQPTGLETLRVINQTWDETSKSVLGKEPQLLGVIQSQRDDGTYDAIIAEIDRQKLLGHIPTNTPLLQAYKIAGDSLSARQLLPVQRQATKPTPTQPAPRPVQPNVVATRPAAPKASQVVNSDKAQAAAPTKSTPRKAAAVINPLAMADEDFLKQFNGRF